MTRCFNFQNSHFTETDNDRFNAYDNDVTFDMMMDSRQY